jgi:hypothetical protein
MSQENKGDKGLVGASTAPTAPVAQKRLFTVKEGSNVFIGGKMAKPGTELQLTDDEAKELGAVVFVGKAKPVDNIATRRGGMYQVAPDRNVLKDGKFLPQGELLELDAAEARSLGDSIEPAA